MNNFIQIIQDIFEKSKTFCITMWNKLSDTVKRYLNRPSPEKAKAGDKPVRSTARLDIANKVRPAPIRRQGRQKVYRLKGYTTVAKVNRKRQSERQQRLLRRILLFVIIFLALVLLFNLYNPFKNMTEWYRFIGISSFQELITGQSTKATTSATTASTSGSASDSSTEGSLETLTTTSS